MLKRTRGFTLVEILIVVIILGILAAIVIPQFTNASQDARRSSLASTLQTLRSQIELFKLQHNDALPVLIDDGAQHFGAAAGWPQFTERTTDQAGNFFGPYMQAAPRNPLNGLQNVVEGDGSAPASSSCGFVYDYATSNPPTGRIVGTTENGTAIYVDENGNPI